MSRLIIFIAALLMTASPAYAGPLAAVLPIIIGAVIKSVIVKIILTIALTVAVSALTKAGQKKSIPPGMQTERKLVGGANSRTIMLGLYATAGSEVCPPMSHGKSGKTPNAYLNVVVALADVPCDSLRRVVINGEYIPIGSGSTAEGMPLQGKYSGKAWIKFYDGRQTVADPYLTSNYPGYVRPWNGSKIGKGVCYAILTYLFDSELYRSEPDVKFELYGMRLYDVRKDGTAGGVGAHRWNDPTTWEFTMNPMVMVYNILRGITFADGSKYGGECTADDLPVANWSAAMNVCDENVTTSSGTEKRYRAGFEINVADLQPADAIEELLKACSGDIVETGGVYKVRVGPPALPVMFINDGDFLVTQAKDYDPFPGINTAKNTVYATYPSPEENWSTHDAPVQTDPAYLTRDQGVELSASLALPAVPFPGQVQRLMLGWLKDDQRWRQHSATLGHYGFILEPLDTISWTSAYNQYVDKLFEVDSCNENLTTLANTIALREVDPSDYNYQVSDELPDPINPGAWDLPPVQAVPGFGASAAAVKDADGNNRRAAILVYWDADAADDADFIKIQARVYGTTDVLIDTTAAIADASKLVSEGILPSTSYEVRGKFIAPNRPTDWSSWFQVETFDVKLGASDVDLSGQLGQDLQDAIDRIAASEQDIAALETTASQLQAGAAQTEAEVVALGGQYSSLLSIVNTQGSSISTNSTAISTLSGQYATLRTVISASGPSILKNSDFSLWPNGSYVPDEWLGWSDVYVTRVTGDKSLYALKLDNPANQQGGVFQQPKFHAGWWVFEYEIKLNANDFYGTGVHLAPIDGSASLVGNFNNYDFGLLHGPGVVGKTYSNAVMVNFTGDTAVMANVHLMGFWNGFASASGHAGQKSFTFNYARLRPASDAEILAQQVVPLSATVITQGQAITSLNTSYASLSSTVSTQGAIVSQNAQAISDLNSNYASLSSTVSSQGGQITQNANSLTNLSGTVSSLSSTVSAQGASISQNATAISGINGSITTLFARVAVTIDVNGYVTGWEANNNGTYGDFVIRADKFQIVKPGGGARTEYSGGNWRVYDSNGVLRFRWGVV